MSFFTEAETLVVPETELRGCRGFALHIGSSMLKFAYIGHIEKHETLNPEFSDVNLELRTATVDKLDQVIEFIKENLLEQRKGRHPFRFQAILTGWHGLEYQDKFAKELGVKIKLIDPVVSYTKFHQYGVIHLGRPTFLHHVIKCPAKLAPLTGETVRSSLNQTPGIEGPGTDHPQRYEREYFDKIEEEFPYLLCAVGSDVTYLKVDDSGRAEDNVLHRSGFGGSSFHATAGLAAGGKDYSELLKMANSGDHKSAGFSRRMDNFPERSTECHVEVEGAVDAEVALAGGIDKAVMLKPLEKVTKGESVKPEDVVATLMYMTCENLVSTAITLARKHEIKKVYFAGAFVHNNQILQKCIKQAPVYDMKNLGPELHVGLTRHPLYACVLGALLDGLHLMQFFVECGGCCGPRNLSPPPPPMCPEAPEEGEESD